MTEKNASVSHGTPPPAEPRPESPIEDIKADPPVTDIRIEHTEEGIRVTADGTLPKPEDIVDQLGIPNWRELEKKIVRRLDLTILPTLWVLYVFNYLDRASLGQARLSTLDKDLNLTGFQFGNAISILSAGYVLGQLPSNMIIGYVRPSLYLPGCALIWSGVSASIAGVKSYEGLLVVRLFLGLAEAPLFPGAIYYMSCWYTRREIAVRIALLSTGVPLANGMSGLIAAAVYANLEGKLGVAGWQWLFIVLASGGGVFALIGMFILPDYSYSRTGSAMWTMTEDMRKVAQARIAADRVSLEQFKPGIWYGLRLSLTDYKLYLMVTLNIFISAAYGFSNFYPSIVRGFGYDRTTTLVMTFPPYVLAAIVSVVAAWSSDRRVERGFHFSGLVFIGMMSYIVCLITTHHHARYAASFFFIGGLFGANPLQYTWVSSTFGRTPATKATSIAINSILGQLGNVMAPYFFFEDDEPRYRVAFGLMFMMAGLTITSAMTLKFCLWRENKKIHRAALANGTAYQPYVL